MDLAGIVHRQFPPAPWAEGDNIPWSEPGFSARMLREHLAQSHDAASRRSAIIDEHVGWIHEKLLAAKPSRILDLGCGPGLYVVRLAANGHTVTGIDYSPASIAYAREAVATSGAAASLLEGDMRRTELGGPYNLVMLIFGELNVFRREEAQELLSRCAAALAPDGRLLLEVSTYDALCQKGNARAAWYAAEQGLWSDRPHIVLQEAHWDAASDTATTRYYVVNPETADVQTYAVTYQAYRDEGYAALLGRAGFEDIDVLPHLGSLDVESGMTVLVARRPATGVSG
jgi:SAM-dependent methyltransferase